MNLLTKIELASDVISLAHGKVPMGTGFRLIPLFFRRKKGMSKAAWKKLMMRKRRRFIDTIVMNNHRTHQKNRENAIDEAKAKLSKKPDKKPAKPNSSPQLTRNKTKQKQNDENRWRSKARESQSRPKQGDQNTIIKGLIDAEKGHVRSKWAVRVNQKTGSKKEI